ncbi:substrate-binding domain-containing protein [Pseudomonas xantholysinigenes]|jgi:ABC-type phosphate transport system substrate-binding protein|uniref:Phosphate-binding protein PstS n=1 Tax=Pseudomonas xantholysinigenes TaxID=2745490 RepID=A0A9E6Q026_9PSED|nr:substrate-binding domain-containing protein [Pseudomonas xantholysinigenes]QXI40740.1 substrate-binding domain-containing protein [Pseudomonas xantholysinigenes]
MFKRTVIAASLVAATLASAQSMAAVVGGGATLPEPLYNGKGALPGILPAGFSYTGVGSGGGKTAFLTNAPASINQPAGTNVDFAGSDSVLSASELSTYNSAKLATWGKLIQVPAVGTSVTIPYKKAGNTTLQLSGAQLCAAFSGSATTWGALLGTSDNTPITVVYRSGSSGTTELLTRFLNDSCASNFSVSSTFTSAKVGSIPAHWKGVSGSGDVMTQINAIDGSIGYISPDYVTPGNNAVVARVSKAAMAAGTAPLPTAANAQTALGTVAAPTAANRANPAAWVPTFGAGGSPIPTAGYPIVGYTNLLVGQCYQDAADASALKGFLNDLYSGNKSTLITAHTFVNLPTAFAAEVKKVFLDNAYGDGLDINNASVCNGIGRS